ncbi:hypothetical protein [Natrinema limicola]|uniref:Uncharacterized protein n=1 Tax=Natrinema limicola JCM 13563 TaxID=1230457 RepID=M0C6W0_9EURY|nr:hypothetical protein [Natrinema limicola]ELZ17669.1 hypothetical protein C476_14593 [Natrinema limicola JCM 13563]
MSNEHPDRDRVQDRAEQRQAERADHTESIFANLERDLGELVDENAASGSERGGGTD